MSDTNLEVMLGRTLSEKDWGKVGVAIANVHEAHPEWINAEGKVLCDRRKDYLHVLAQELAKVFYRSTPE